MVRAIAADPAASAPPPPTGLDPRATYGYGIFASARFTRAFWAAVDRPVLAVETPASTTPAEERAERASWFGGAVTVVELDTGAPAAVVEAIRAWPAPD
jgi:hypothetical protein